MNLFYYLSAFGIGALHALEPGHGKSIMGAYLIMSRGRLIDAVVLGLTSAATHTLVILTMAVTAQFAASQVSTHFTYAEQTTLWLQLLSGILMVIIGTRLFPLKKKHTCCNHHHAHQTPINVGHAGGQKINTLDLLLVGFTNGLIPCPSALAVLLMSLSTGQLFQGLSLVLAFGIGGAVALIAVGIVFIKISSFAGKSISAHNWLRFSAISSLLIIGTGTVISYKAFQGLV